jgi:quercetin dioxygenase-like cupin family protein
MPGPMMGKTARMQKFSLDAIAREQAKQAAGAPAGRSAETVYGGHEHSLRQTVLALTAGSSLTEHENPGEATIVVLRGRVRLTAGERAWEGRSGDLLVVPESRHALEALEDSAILLTVSKAVRAWSP